MASASSLSQPTPTPYRTTPAGVEIDTGHLPGVEHGIPDREDGDRRTKLDALGHRGRDGKCGVHLQVQSHGRLHVGKLEALGRGRQDVLRLELGRDHDVVGGPQPVKTGGLSRSAKVDDEFRGGQRSEVGDDDAYVHGVPKEASSVKSTRYSSISP